MQMNCMLTLLFPKQPQLQTIVSRNGSTVSSVVPLSRKRVLLADFAAALSQQMYYWGRDVLSGGNLLLKRGFEKLPSPGLKGTSCYRIRHEEGLIELHGACAGWYPGTDGGRPGLLFVRKQRRCAAHHLHEPVVPGSYPAESLSHDTADVLAASQFFAGWMLDYEEWVLRRMGRTYRPECRRMLASLPRGEAWLPDSEARRWMRLFQVEGARAPRARTLAREVAQDMAALKSGWSKHW